MFANNWTPGRNGDSYILNCEWPFSVVSRSLGSLGWAFRSRGLRTTRKKAAQLRFGHFAAVLIWQNSQKWPHFCAQKLRAFFQKLARFSENFQQKTNRNTCHASRVAKLGLEFPKEPVKEPQKLPESCKKAAKEPQKPLSKSSSSSSSWSWWRQSQEVLAIARVWHAPARQTVCGEASLTNERRVSLVLSASFGPKESAGVFV